MPDRKFMWTGDPICYKRSDGSSLIVGKHHYLFDGEGNIESAQPVTRPVLATILQHLYKDNALAMAAYLKPVPEAKVYSEEEMQNQVAEGEQQVEALQQKVAAAEKLGATDE